MNDFNKIIIKKHQEIYDLRNVFLNFLNLTAKKMNLSYKYNDQIELIL